jgi:hypothetical protein
MNNEIILVEHWEWVWVDGKTGMPYVGGLTGTPATPFPYVVHRYIQLGHLMQHRGCGGTFHRKWTTRWEGSCSFTTEWKECDTCGKKIDFEEL